MVWGRINSTNIRSRQSIASAIPPTYVNNKYSPNFSKRPRLCDLFFRCVRSAHVPRTRLPDCTDLPQGKMQAVSLAARAVARSHAAHHAEASSLHHHAATCAPLLLVRTLDRGRWRTPRARRKDPLMTLRLPSTVSQARRFFAPTRTFVRRLNLHEVREPSARVRRALTRLTSPFVLLPRLQYQSAALMAEKGVNVPMGIAAHTVEEVGTLQPTTPPFDPSSLSPRLPRPQPFGAFNVHCHTRPSKSCG